MRRCDSTGRKVEVGFLKARRSVSRTAIQQNSSCFQFESTTVGLGGVTSMQRVMPTLRSTSYAKSKAFCVDGLGFQVDWEHRFEPNFPVFMQVSRDDMAFFLTEHRGDCPVGGLVHLYVPDVDAW